MQKEGRAPISAAGTPKLHFEKTLKLFFFAASSLALAAPTPPSPFAAPVVETSKTFVNHVRRYIYTVCFYAAD